MSDSIQPTDSYHKVHRAYMLVAGLLAAWELIGLSVTSKAGQTEASASAGPLSGISVVIRTPEAGVWVLVALFLYFAVRFSLVWGQQAASVRASLAVRWDYWLSHGIGAASLAIWFIQTVNPLVRIGEFLTGPWENAAAVVAMFAVAMAVVFKTAQGIEPFVTEKARASATALLQEYLPKNLSTYFNTEEKPFLVLGVLINTAILALGICLFLVSIL